MNYLEIMAKVIILLETQQKWGQWNLHKKMIHLNQIKIILLFLICILKIIHLLEVKEMISMDNLF